MTICITTVVNRMSEIRSAHDSEDIDCSILSCDATEPCRWFIHVSGLNPENGGNVFL